MQSNAEGVHDGEGSAQGDRYGEGGDDRDPQRQEQDGDNHHGDDGQQELVTEVRNPLVITSYSIHYTKLYDVLVGNNPYLG